MAPFFLSNLYSNSHMERVAMAILNMVPKLDNLLERTSVK